MSQKAIIILFIFSICLGLMGCSSQKSNDNATKNDKQELLIYCGITMVKPMRAVADTFEKENNCQIILNQGGSQDLYDSLQFSKKGDLYLPGSESYRNNNLQDGLLGEAVYLGFNQASFIVQKGNPKQIKGTLDSLLDPNLAVVVGNPETCSIGKMTKRILSQAGIYDEVVANCFTLGADSRNLNSHIKEETADLIVNWRATGFFGSNKGFVEVIDLNTDVSPKTKILLSELTFSNSPDLAKKFMAFASSKEGQQIFREYGFLE